jgi:DUF1680 family protein
MDGRRVPSTEDIAFQKRPGSEQLNCCSVNAARGFGMISEWALMQGAGGLVLNWYGPSTMTAKVGEVPVRIEQDTDYPRGGRVIVRVEPQRDLEFTLKLRVPHWSRDTQVAVNDQQVPGAKPGEYLELRRTWRKGDRVAIDFDMSLRAWAGERECAGKASLYRGPILLAYEAAGDAPPPELNLASVMTRAAPADVESMVKVDVRDNKGTVVRLRDYGTAGKDRKPYVTWLPAKGMKPTPFTRSNPLRSTHAGS